MIWNAPHIWQPNNFLISPFCLKPVPHYYSSLAPFREVFSKGLPLLTYHHVGAPRRGARIKGLYVSPKLFARQVAELGAAGFSTARLGSALGAVPNEARQVCLTFDDGFRDVFEHALP